MLSHAFLSGRQRYDPQTMLPRRAAIMMLVAMTCIFHLSSGVLAFTPSVKAQPSFGVISHGANRYHGRSALGYSNERDWPISVATAAATRRRRDNFPLRMISLEVVGDKEIPEMAEFFVSNFWEVDVPPSQRRPLVRELVSDYRRRYGSFVGKRKFPSMLLSARNGAGEVVGCVAIEVSVCMEECVGIKARGISPNAKGAELRPILANLAVGRSSRRKGLAKRLVKRCEEAAKEWGYDEVLLLVEENNNRAKRLYQKLGYKTLFIDRNAKKVVADSYQIRDVPCVNVCMRRDLNANIFSDLFSQFIRQSWTV